MDPDAIIVEMQRKPDAHLALEWIADNAQTIEQAREAAEAYFAGVEGA